MALLSTAVATMLFIAPVSFHRIVFRRRQKRALVIVADRLLVAGLALLVPAICSSLLLILDVVLGRWPAILGSSFTASVGLLTWYVAPAVRPPLRPRRAVTVPPPAAGDPRRPPDAGSFATAAYPAGVMPG